MIKLSATFDNERGEEVDVDVIYYRDKIEVSITRPSESEAMSLTRLEMAALRNLLNPMSVEPTYKVKSSSTES